MTWFVRVLRSRDTLALEAFLAMQAILVGAVIAAPGQVFAMGVLVPEVVLGGLMVTHGLGAMIALYRLDARNCRRSALASVGLWTFMITLLAITPPADFVVLPLVIGLAIGALWVYVRLAVWARV